MKRPLILAAALLAATPLASAQTLMGVDGGGLVTWEFASSPGGPCGAPNPLFLPVPYAAPLCPGMAPPGPMQPGTFFGDIADDPLTDTYFVTDGFMIEQYAFEGACAPALYGTPLNMIPGAGITGAPLTGLGMDPTGVTTGGFPALWCTDGFAVWAIGVPPVGSCVPAPILVPPCVVPGTGLAPLTDITVDTSTGTLWACDAGGVIYNFSPGCVPFAATPVAPGPCGLGPLTGIAFDTGTPNLVTGTGPAVYVTDGFVVAYIDPFTGAPAAPTFYTPNTCSPTPAFLSGLALTQHEVEYGMSRFNSSLKAFGQSSSPGPTFGLEINGAPPGTNGFLILNFSFPGPGFFCPAVPGVGTRIWVDPTPPGAVIPLGTMPGGCFPIPLPIPPGAPSGLNLFAQAVFVPVGGPPAADATNGIAATFTLP